MGGPVDFGESTLAKEVFGIQMILIGEFLLDPNYRVILCVVLILNYDVVNLTFCIHL